MKAATKKVTFGKMEESGITGDDGAFSVYVDGEFCGEIIREMAQVYYGEYRVASYSVQLHDDGDSIGNESFDVDGVKDVWPYAKMQRSEYKTAREAMAAAKAYARKRAVEIAEAEEAEAQEEETVEAPVEEKNQVFPVGSQFGTIDTDDEDAREQVWTVNAVEGDVMEISSRTFHGSYHQAWNGDGTYFNETRWVTISNNKLHDVRESKTAIA